MHNLACKLNQKRNDGTWCAREGQEGQFSALFHCSSFGEAVGQGEIEGPFSGQFCLCAPRASVDVLETFTWYVPVRKVFVKMKSDHGSYYSPFMTMDGQIGKKLLNGLEKFLLVPPWSDRMIAEILLVISQK